MQFNTVTKNVTDVLHAEFTAIDDFQLMSLVGVLHVRHKTEHIQCSVS